MPASVLAPVISKKNALLGRNWDWFPRGSHVRDVPAVEPRVFDSAIGVGNLRWQQLHAAKSRFSSGVLAPTAR
jgi:hypothetical protein